VPAGVHVQRPAHRRRLGRPRGFARGFPARRVSATHGHQRRPQQRRAGKVTQAYAQDDWKVTSRLTLNLGLRYELATPWVDKFDAINTVYPDPAVRSRKFPNAPVGMLFPGDLPRGLYDTDKNNFAPRIGFAWDVFGDGKTAVRGAFGIFYDTINTDSIAQKNPSFVGGRRAFTNGNLTNPFTSVGATAPPAFVDPSAFTFTRSTASSAPKNGISPPLM
jgi:hypothetical protein